MKPQASGIVCPRCHRAVAADRLGGMTVVCDSCGFVISASERRLESANHRSFVFAASGVIMMFAAMFIQVSAWDNHAVDVIPLQVRGTLGVASVADHEKMAEICLERKRYGCVEREYSRVAKDDLVKIFRLAKFQMNRQRYDDAVRTFGTFFQKGGSDAEAAFLFARALSYQGRHEEASKYYKYVLSSNPDPLMKSAASEGLTRAVRGIAGAAKDH